MTNDPYAMRQFQQAVLRDPSNAANLHAHGSAPKTVPLSLNPAVVARYMEVDADGKVIADPAITAAHNALTKAHAIAERLADGVNKALGNPAHPPAQRMLNAEKLRNTHAPEISKHVDEALQRVDATLSSITAGTWRPTPGASARDISIEAQCRDVLRSMTPDQRNKTIASAIEDDDTNVLAAVLSGGSPMLVGLTADQVGAYRGMWRQKNFPEAVAKQARYQKARDALERAGKATVGFAASLIDDNPSVRAAREAEKTMKALEAAAAAREG